MYYREFGIPARIARAYTSEELEEHVSKYNGIKSCYTSVYCFDNMKDIESKANYDSAVINGIWFDFDHNKDVNKCLLDVRKFIRKYCVPRKIIPRLYLTGGKGFQMNIDFKTKEFGADHKQLSYESMAYQLIAYAVTGLDKSYRDTGEANVRRMANIFISSTNPGLSVFHEWKKEDFERYWEVFSSSLTLWKNVKQYWPEKHNEGN